MAKKRTISDLLGTSEGRVQADLNLPKVQLQPSIGRAGTYSLGKVYAPKENEFTKLADALGQINSTIKDYQQAQITKEQAYITEAEAGVKEFQNKWDAAGSKEERDKMLAELQKSKNKTEREIDKQFREDFGANFLATKRIRKMMGQESVAEAKAYMADQIKQFKQRNIEENGEIPTFEETQAFLATLPDAYLEQEGAADMSDPLVKQGYVEGLKPTMDKYTETLYEDFSNHAKTNVYIPKKANQIRAILLDESGLTRQEKVDKIKLLYGDGEMMLGMADQTKLLNKVLDGVAAEDLDVADDMLDILGELKVGNQTFRENEDLFNGELEELENRYDKYIAEQEEEARQTVRTEMTKIDNEVTDMIYSPDGGDLSDIDAYLAQQIEEVKTATDEDGNPRFDSQTQDMYIEQLEARREQLISRVTQLKNNVETLAVGADPDIFYKQVNKFALEGMNAYKADGGTVSAGTTTPVLMEQTITGTGGVEYTLTPAGSQILGPLFTEFNVARDALVESSLKQVNAKGERLSQAERAQWLTDNVGELNTQYHIKIKDAVKAFFEVEQSIKDEKAAAEKQAALDKAKEELREQVGITTRSSRTGQRKSINTLGEFYDAADDNASELMRTGAAIVGSENEELVALYSKTYQASAQEAAQLKEKTLGALNRKPNRGQRGGVRQTNPKTPYLVEDASDSVRFDTFKPEDVLEMIKSGEGNETYVHVENGEPTGLHVERDFFKSPIYIEGLTADSEAAKALAKELGVSVDEVIKSNEQIKSIREMVQ